MMSSEIYSSFLTSNDRHSSATSAVVRSTSNMTTDWVSKISSLGLRMVGYGQFLTTSHLNLAILLTLVMCPAMTAGCINSTALGRLLKVNSTTSSSPLTPTACHVIASSGVMRHAGLCGV